MSYQMFDIPQKQNEESNLGYAGRQIARTGARALEAAIGMPGDIASAVEGGVDFLGSLLPGSNANMQSEDPEFVKRKEEFLQQNPAISAMVNSPLRKIGGLPTSEQLKENITKPLTGEYLDPKTENEAGWDNIVQDAVALFTPMGGGAKNILKAGAKAVTRSGLGNLAKWGTELITNSPLAGTIAKFTTNILSGLKGSRAKLKEVKENAYKDAFQNLPENAKVNVKNTKKTFTDLINEISKSDSPDKANMIERLSAFFNNVQDGDIANVKDLVKLKQSWGEWLKDAGLPKKTYDLIYKAIGKVNDDIANYGKRNAAFFTPYKIGEGLTAGFNSQSLFQQAINQNPRLKSIIKNPFVNYLLFHGGSKIMGAAGAAKIAVPLVAANEASKIIQLIAKSPTAMKHYGKMIQAAGMRNIPAVGREMKAFDKAASKQLKNFTLNDYSPKKSQKGKFVLYNL